MTPEEVTGTTADSSEQPGRLLALDLGSKRVGLAVCDELRLTVRPLPAIQRRSWKDLLNRVTEQIGSFEARGLVIGLPLNFDGSEGAAAQQARETAETVRDTVQRVLIGRTGRYGTGTIPKDCIIDIVPARGVHHLERSIHAHQASAGLSNLRRQMTRAASEVQNALARLRSQQRHEIGAVLPHECMFGIV